MTREHLVAGGAALCQSASASTLTASLLVRASSLAAGHCVRTVDGVEKVVRVDKVRSPGVYTVVTNEEFLVVSGVIASPFSMSHMVPNSYYNVLRVLYALSPGLLRVLRVQKVTDMLGNFLFKST
jgi:hypothetical protein